MYDVKWIRDNPGLFDEGRARRGLAPLSATIVELDDRRRGLVSKLQASQERRNAASREIGQAKAQKDEPRAQALMAEVASLKTSMPADEEALRDADKALFDQLSSIPNQPLDDVPVGADEHANIERHRYGIAPAFTFAPREHFQLGEALGQMDFETAAKLSGARFVVLKRQLARLERALGQYMLDLHTTEHGYTEVNPPLLVRDEAVFGTNQLPKFAEDLFRVQPGDFWLIPTAEVSLDQFGARRDHHRGRVAPAVDCSHALLPCRGRRGRTRYAWHDPAAPVPEGRLVSITTPEQSRDEHERMLACAEAALKGLDLHYRVVTLCTGDMGFGAQKTYDIEVWLPGQNQFREISSCSVCGDFQARRMNARSRPRSGGPPRFVHTLNGSGVAVGRALVAVMENYQNEDGSITVPDRLVSYMGGLDRIGRN